MRKRHLAGVAAAACGALLVASCDPCAEEVLSRQPSPDGRFVAEFVEIDCGATTDYQSVVILRSAGEQATVLSMKYHQSIHLTWQGSEALLIEYHRCRGDKGPFQIEGALDTWRSVRVQHREGEPIACPSVPSSGS